MPPLELPLPEGAQVLPLPDGKSLKLPALDFAALVENRETLRKYSPNVLSLAELAYLLWGTQGVKTISDKGVTRRTVASAGARHAFETYLLVNRVEGLEPGLYRYLALKHQIARLPAPVDFNQQLTQACLNQSHVANSAVTFVWVADTQRMTWRYVERGYRYMFPGRRPRLPESLFAGGIHRLRGVPRWRPTTTTWSTPLCIWMGKTSLPFTSADFGQTCLIKKIISISIRLSVKINLFGELERPLIFFKGLFLICNLLIWLRQILQPLIFKLVKFQPKYIFIVRWINNSLAIYDFRLFHFNQLGKVFCPIIL